MATDVCCYGNERIALMAMMSFVSSSFYLYSFYLYGQQWSIYLTNVPIEHNLFQLCHIFTIKRRLETHAKLNSVTTTSFINLRAYYLQCASLKNLPHQVLSKITVSRQCIRHHTLTLVCIRRRERLTAFSHHSTQPRDATVHTHVAWIQHKRETLFNWNRTTWRWT